MNDLDELAGYAHNLRHRLDPDTYEGFLAWKIANWTLDALAASHPTAAELAPAVGVTLALEMAERYRERDYAAVGFRGER